MPRGRYYSREWATIQKKLHAPSAADGATGATGGGAAADGLRACLDIRFDGIGERQIADDELGSEEAQLRVLGLLYLGCETLWYHLVGSEHSRARLLHVQGIDGSGAWHDPTVCKLAPTDLLRAEADAHAVFARYIGESVPQRIGEPVYVDEIGGMVLELVGACWRMPELAHTQATLSNTFADVIKYDSDHAAELAAPLTQRDRPVFGEVRTVIDEVFLSQLSAVVRQTAHREHGASLLEHYGLLPKIRKLAERMSMRDDTAPASTSSLLHAVKPATLAALRALQEKLALVADAPDGPPDYPGPWFGVVHGDLHGGNIMVDSRSYAWLIDYGEVRGSLPSAATSWPWLRITATRQPVVTLAHLSRGCLLCACACGASVLPVCVRVVPVRMRVWCPCVLEWRSCA
jgi:hypothetical protein